MNSLKNSTRVQAAQPPKEETPALDRATLAALEELQASLGTQNKASLANQANPVFWTGSIDASEIARIKALSEDGPDLSDLFNEDELQQLGFKDMFDNGLVVPLNDADPIEQKSVYSAYLCNNEGVWLLHPEVDRKTQMNTGRTAKKLVIDANIIPVETIEALEADNKTSTSYVKFVYQKGIGTEYREVTLKYAAVISPMMHRNEIHELMEAGIEEGCLKKSFGPHMKALIREGVARGLIKQSKGRNKTGWHGDIHLRAGLPGYAGNLTVVNSVMGDAKVWRDTLAEMVSESPVTGIAVAANMGAYLRGHGKLTLETSHLLHFHGNPGQGKTLAINAACSVQGYPNQHGIGTFIESSTTPAAFERILASCNDGPVAADEIQSLINLLGYNTEARVVSFFVRLLNGGGRRKADKGSSDSVHAGFTWNSTILTTGNADLGHIADAAGQQGDALHDRIIEIDTRAHRVWPWDDSLRASRYLDTLTQNHGHGYAPTIEYIVQNQHQLIKSHNEYHGQFAEGMRKYKRKAKAFALYRVGIDIMQHVLDLTPEVTQKVVDKLNVLIDEVSNRATREVNEADANVATELVGFVNANLGNFVVKGCLWAHQQGNIVPSKGTQQGEATTHSSTVNPVWGYINQSTEMKGAGEFDDIIGFTATGVQEAKKRNVNIPDLAANAKELQFLEINKSDPSRNTKKHAKYGNCYEFNIGKALMAQAQAVQATQNAKVSAASVTPAAPATAATASVQTTATGLPVNLQMTQDEQSVVLAQAFANTIDSLFEQPAGNEAK